MNTVVQLFVLGLVLHSVASAVTELEENVNSTIPVMIEIQDYMDNEAEINAMVDRADLSHHGYTKEMITNVTTAPGTPPTTEKVYNFYKVIPCHRVPAAEEELASLFPGVFNAQSFRQLNEKILSSPGALAQMCQVGLKVQLLPVSAHAQSRASRMRRNTCYWRCSLCRLCIRRCSTLYCLVLCNDVICCACK